MVCLVVGEKDRFRSFQAGSSFEMSGIFQAGNSFEMFSNLIDELEDQERSG